MSGGSGRPAPRHPGYDAPVKTLGLLAVLLSAGCGPSTPGGVPHAASDHVLSERGDGDTASRPTVAPTSATWAELIARVPTGATEVSRDPSTDERVPHPVAAEIAARLVRGERPSDVEWAELLVRSGAVRHRETWPVDQPWVLSMRVPNWLGQTTIRLQPRTEGLLTAEAGGLIGEECGFEHLSRVVRAAHQALGNVGLGDQQIVFDAEVLWLETPYAWHFPNLPDPETSVVWKGPITLSVRGVASLADALPPVRGPEVEAAVQRAIKLTPMDGRVHLEFTPGDDPLLRGLALSLEVELHYGGEPRERLEFCFPLPCPLEGMPEPSQPILLSQQLAPETIALIRERGTWTIAVRGKEDPLLLRNSSANRHFAGSYEFQAP